MSEDASIKSHFATYTVHKVGESYWDVLEDSRIGRATVATCTFESQARRVAAGLAVLDACGQSISHGLVIDGTGAANAPAVVHALRFAAARQ